MSILSSQIHDLKNLAGRIDDTHDRKTITGAVWTIEQLSEKARVVHAHWEYDPNGMDWNMGAWRCSKCKGKNKNIACYEKANPLLFTGSSYCPSCGAKMDEKSTEERANEM